MELKNQLIEYDEYRDKLVAIYRLLSNDYCREDAKKKIENIIDIMVIREETKELLKKRMLVERAKIKVETNSNLNKHEN